MFKIDIKKLVPQFILDDKNGYALAKAIEAGAQMMNDIVGQGVKCVTDYDTMPEWRLDELAWETNCLYNYQADIEEKRRWIREAIPWYKSYGTPEAVKKLVKAILGDGDVKEWFEYGGKPYSFKIVAYPTISFENGIDGYFLKMLQKAKNVRSCMDGIDIHNAVDIKLHTGAKQYVSGDIVAKQNLLTEGSD